MCCVLRRIASRRKPLPACAASARGVHRRPFGAELEKLLPKFPLPSILKSTRMGYDGKGQVKMTTGYSPALAWKEMGGEAGILESFIDFACEISVIVARRADGATAAYPASRTFTATTSSPRRMRRHRSTPRWPGSRHIARRLAEKLNIVGLLAVEMFVLKQPTRKGSAFWSMRSRRDRITPATGRSMPAPAASLSSWCARSAAGARRHHAAQPRGDA